MDDKEREDVEAGDSRGIVGGVAGVGGGALLGTAIGAAFGGPVGAAVGAAVGTVAGAGVGYALDFDSHEPEFRQHHESSPTLARHTWEQAAPAYRYGWESYLRPEFKDKTFHQARHELHKGWTGSSDFADYEGYVEHAWQRQAASRQAGSFSPAAKE